MKKVLVLLFSLIMLSSCGVYWHDDTFDADYTTVVTYGKPYYIDGVCYYLYRHTYYCPYQLRGRFHVRPVRYIQPPRRQDVRPDIKPEMGRPDTRNHGQAPVQGRKR